MASGDWSEEEQRLLEEGLLQAAPICNPREKWQAIARVVGTRDARACAERFRLCREQALERQRREAQDDGDQEAEEEEEDEEEEGEGGAAPEAGHSGAAASSSSGSGYAKGQREWKGNWWSHGWQSNGGGRGGQGGWEWSDGWKWEGSASWGAPGENEAAEGGSSAADGQAWESAGGQEAEDLSGLDERQRRALEMKREVEANRERLRLKQEREENERLRREQKKADEEAAREQERRENREKQERERQEQMEQQRLRQFLQEKEAKAAMAKASQFNPGFAPARMVGGREVKATTRDWAAKANAGVKGQMAKQRKQELLEKQAAEALANIASSKGQAAKKQESSDEEDYAPPAPAPPPAARPAAPPPAKAAAAPPAKAPPAKAKAASAPSEPPRKSNKKRWWAKLDGDCPISLAPLSELPRPPFGLEAEGSSNMHYFDARFLASFLLSSCDFIDPVNRRPLTREECGALDGHLSKHHPEVGVEASVADAFTLFERHGTSGASQVHAVQREATAVLQHLFRFGSARRTDQRGRAIAYADAGLTVVDDDDILAAGAPAAPAEPDLDRMTSADFPQLAEGEGSAGASGGRGGWGGGRGGRPPGGGGGSAGGGRGSGGGSAFPALPTSAKAKPKAWGPASKVGAAAAKAKSGPGRGGKGRGGRGGRPDAW